MSKQDPQTQKLLRRWLAGLTGHRDERQLGREAAEDPFLRDALTGYRQYPESDHESKLAQLRTQLHWQRRRRPVYWPVIATAAIVLLAFGIWWSIPPGIQKGAFPIAGQKSAETEETLAPIADASPAEENEVINDQALEKRKSTLRTTLQTDTPPTARIRDTEVAPLSTITDSRTKKIWGKTITPIGQPLTGIKVFSPSLKDTALSGPEGQFQLFLPAVNSQLMVQIDGTTKGPYAIGENDSLLLAFPLAGAGISPPASSVAKSRGRTNDQLQPNIGITQLYAYLLERLEPPRDTFLLYFAVYPDGHLQHFSASITDSSQVNPLVRALETGPSWSNPISNRLPVWTQLSWPKPLPTK